MFETENVPQEIIDHYDRFLSGYSVYEEPDPGTSAPHLRWMLRQLNTFIDARKAHRWLGFIQCRIIDMGYTTVTEERDFTRGKF